MGAKENCPYSGTKMKTHAHDIGRVEMNYVKVSNGWTSLLSVNAVHEDKLATLEAKPLEK